MLNWTKTPRGEYTEDTGRFYIKSPMGRPVGNWVLFDDGAYATDYNSVSACMEHAGKLLRIEARALASWPAK